VPSLENRVAYQRDTLMARGPRIRRHGQRAVSRLRHPVVLIPAFLAGMLFGRGAPVLLRVLPKLTARLGNFREVLGKLDAIVRLITSLLPMLQHPSGAKADDTGQRPSPT
jgi:hypothetical protein